MFRQNVCHEACLDDSRSSLRAGDAAPPSGRPVEQTPPKIAPICFSAAGGGGRCRRPARRPFAPGDGTPSIWGDEVEDAMCVKCSIRHRPMRLRIDPFGGGRAAIELAGGCAAWAGMRHPREVVL